jgi:nucleotide-binding universal stress UspA family protein
MEIKKLLFATQFEELWFDALQSLLDLRKASLSHVVFLNVIEREQVAMRRGTGYKKDEEIKLREKANIRFIDWAEPLFEEGMEVGVYIVVGSLVQQVIVAAEKEKADLIVLGKERKTKVEQLFQGSDISEILRRANTPVLVYKYVSKDGRVTEKPFEQPLLATNGSPACERAVQCLEALHDVVKQVHLVHVVDEKELKGTSGMAIQKTRKQSRQQLDKVCDTLARAGIQAKSHVYIGETVDQIEKAARECQATMIITGTSERKHWKERLLGSVPTQLAEKSLFPTLIIPPL